MYIALIILIICVFLPHTVFRDVVPRGSANVFVQSLISNGSITVQSLLATKMSRITENTSIRVWNISVAHGTTVVVSVP